METECPPIASENGPEPVQRLRALVEFLPVFLAPGFEFGRYDARGYWDYSDASEEFIRAVYRHGWIDTGFDWSEWMGTDESRALREDSAVLAGATPQQLARLLTAYVRGDRFCEGALEGAFKSGLLVRILERATALLAELAAGADVGDWSWPTIDQGWLA